MIPADIKHKALVGEIKLGTQWKVREPRAHAPSHHEREERGDEKKNYRLRKKSQSRDGLVQSINPENRECVHGKDHKGPRR